MQRRRHDAREIVPSSDPGTDEIRLLRRPHDPAAASSKQSTADGIRERARQRAAALGDAELLGETLPTVSEHITNDSDIELDDDLLSSLSSPSKRPRRATKRPESYMTRLSLTKPAEEGAHGVRREGSAFQAPSDATRLSKNFSTLIRERRANARKGLDPAALKYAHELVQLNSRHNSAGTSSVLSSILQDSEPGTYHQHNVVSRTLKRHDSSGTGSEAVLKLLAQDAEHGALGTPGIRRHRSSFWAAEPRSEVLSGELNWPADAAPHITTLATATPAKCERMLRAGALEGCAASDRLVRWLVRHILLAADENLRAAATDALMSVDCTGHALTLTADVARGLGADVALLGAYGVDTDTSRATSPASTQQASQPYTQPVKRCVTLTRLLDLVARYPSDTCSAYLALLLQLCAYTPRKAEFERMLEDIVQGMDENALAVQRDCILRSLRSQYPDEQLALVNAFPSSSSRSQAARVSIAIGAVADSLDAPHDLAALLSALPRAELLRQNGSGGWQGPDTESRLQLISLATAGIDALVTNDALSAVTRNLDTAAARSIRAAARFLQWLKHLYGNVQDHRGAHMERMRVKFLLQRMQLRMRYQIHARLAGSERSAWSALVEQADGAW